MIPSGVFLDRDGVINEEVDYLCRPEQLILIPNTAEAIRRLNDAHIPVVVVTNQSIVARGMCSEDTLRHIHHRLVDMLRQQAGARIDALYYCPHLPERPDSKANPEYCTDCNCRKPRIGLLVRACTDLKLDLSRCLLIGDTTCDLQCGRNAGCTTMGVRTGYACADGRYPVSPDHWADDLAAAVDRILAGSQS